MSTGRKLLSIAVPCYNSEAYMRHAVDSLLPGGDAVEILIVNDGSQDATAEIADSYARRYPGIVRAIHKQNGGHGDAVMTGLRHAQGLYFKVVDSDDWVDEAAYPVLLETLRTLEEQPVDMFISNFIYDKVGKTRKKSVSYRHAMPVGRRFGWEDVGHFKKGQYLLMHSVIYRTQLLNECGLELPKHTFYVDELYVYHPLAYVKSMYYLDVNFYHYFIGRQDQSVQEDVTLRRIDQQLLVNRLLMTSADPFSVSEKSKRRYMLNYLETITMVSSVLLTKGGLPSHIEKKQALWQYISSEAPRIYRTLNRRIIGHLVQANSRIGRASITAAYGVARRIIGFN